MRVWGLVVVIAASLSLGGCGPTVTQRFEASPQATYNAFEGAWGSPSKTFTNLDGQNVPVELSVDKVEGKSLAARLTVDGKEAASISLTMNGVENGTATDVDGDLSVDSPLFWRAMGESDGPQINDLVASVALKSMLREAATQMKEGGSLGFGSPFGSLGRQARTASTADPEHRDAQVRRQAEAATRPTTSTRGIDVSGSDVSGSSVRPSVDPSRGTHGY